MAKYRYRIEGSRYGGELVVGEINPNFARHYQDHECSELVDVVLDADDWHNHSDSDEPQDALLDPNTPPSPSLDGEPGFNMWENDDLEHLNGPYADGGFTVYEVPADSTDDWDYEKEVYDGEAILVYGREGAYFSREEPTENAEEYIPVLAFHSSEKGTFGVWFVDTDEPFDEFKLGYGICETNLCELVDNVYYDKQELDADYDYNDTTGKSYDADIGWLNKKWRDPFDNYSEIDEETWEDFNDNVEWERENR